MSPDSARGFAASKGVKLDKAMATGRSASYRLRPPPESVCTALESCDRPRKDGFYWCPFHYQKAVDLGVQPQPVQ